MASASVTSASVLLQKASQQYLECRRKVSAKVDEVKTLESEIQTLFAHITALGETNTRATKSVGRLELQITNVEGDAPVDNAVVSVEIDPEYEEPASVEEPVKEASEEPVTEATEAPVKEASEEASEEQEKKEEEQEAATEEEAEAEEKKEKETEKSEETAEVEEAAEKAEEAKEAPRRSVQWNDADGFPLKVVFDPVQSREAVVTISIAPAAEDGEETEPVKEFRIPVASLFQTGAINRVYVLKKVEHVHVDKAALTEVADEDVPVKAADDENEAEKPVETAEAAEAATDKTEDEEKKTEEEEEKTEEEAEKAAEPVAEDSEKPEGAAADASAEPVAEVPEAPHETLVAAVATIESEDKVVVLKEGKLHVQVHFTMSEIEKLSQTAIALSQQKQEAEAVLAVLEREALSLRTKYERLNASQRSLSAGGVVKPRSTLLGGRGLGGAGAVTRPEKSAYQKAKDSFSAVFTPQRTQVITSFAIFCGSVALFHFQGENLLA